MACSIVRSAVRRPAASTSAFKVAIDGHRLQASAWGEPVSVRRHRPKVEVKGATFTALCVAQDEAGGWLAQTVVDV